MVRSYNLELTGKVGQMGVTRKEKGLDPQVGYTTTFEQQNQTSASSSKRQVASTSTEVSLGTLKAKKGWDIAFASAKSIPMNAIMMYMSGNSLAIFSIMITGMMLFQPFKALVGVHKAFEKLEGGDQPTNLLLQKLTYLLLNLVVMSMGLYKCAAMGLLPTSTSDWLAFTPPPTFETTLLPPS